MEKDLIRLDPSILSVDFVYLRKQVVQAEQAGADRIHNDAMDGHYVPNLSMGAPIVQSLHRITRLPLEIHLMISDPDYFLDEFVEAGADCLSSALGRERQLASHNTTDKALRETYRPGHQSSDSGGSVGRNPLGRGSGARHDGQPGFGHQRFIHTTLPKIRRIPRMIDESSEAVILGVDGGIDASTAPPVVDAGANVLVAGRPIFWARKKKWLRQWILRASLKQPGTQSREVR